MMDDIFDPNSDRPVGSRGTLVTDKLGVPLQGDMPADTAELVGGQIAALVWLAGELSAGLGEGRTCLIKIETDEGDVLIENGETRIRTTLRGDVGRRERKKRAKPRSPRGR
jgi:predicted regulator of Ras-like GTPase activity (Roadblock/LC7/MglB family)